MTILTTYNLIQAFWTKLQVFKKDISMHAFIYFPNLENPTLQTKINLTHLTED